MIPDITGYKEPTASLNVSRHNRIKYVILHINKAFESKSPNQKRLHKRLLCVLFLGKGDVYENTDFTNFKNCLQSRCAPKNFCVKFGAHFFILFYR